MELSAFEQHVLERVVQGQVTRLRERYPHDRQKARDTFEEVVRGTNSALELFQLTAAKAKGDVMVPYALKLFDELWPKEIRV